MQSRPVHALPKSHRRLPDYRKHYWDNALDTLIGIKDKYIPETLLRFGQMNSPYPGQKPNRRAGQRKWRMH
jgi:hypothetical protein